MAVTDREQEILALIRQNPMISQNELAELCGITRSGVAAHISNLTRKGYIQGKGYVLTPQRYVAVVGGVNMDIYGRAAGTVVGPSSNVGRIVTYIGGIARNVSFDLTRLGVPNYLISVYGDDYNGERFKADSAENGLDITHSRQLPHTDTSTYMSVIDETGRQLVGLDDMEIISEHITPDFLETRRALITRASCTVLDSSLSHEAIAWLCEHCANPLFARVTSVNKASRLTDALPYLDTVVLSAPEANVVCGVEVRGEADADRCAERLLEAGVRNAMLFLDDSSILYRSAERRVFLPCIVDAEDLMYRNGAASAALAALVWSGLEGCAFEERARRAMVMAHLSMECVSATNPALSVAAVEEHRARFGE